MSCGCNAQQGLRNRKCTGCACKQFKKLSVGTRLFIILGDDEYFEDQEYTFACLDEKDCLVTLKEYENGDNVFVVDCRAVRGIKIVRD